ncbi:hypothetical protein P9112_007558 [Eukaryota sp. TZLM1-RC]
MLPEHETDQQRNSLVMNQDKKYKWLRMTQTSWSLKSRMNEKQKRWATKYTEVDYDSNQMIESNEMTIEVMKGLSICVVDSFCNYSTRK